MEDRQILSSETPAYDIGRPVAMIAQEFQDGFEAVDRIRKPAVTIFGSARVGNADKPYQLARATGRRFAEIGWATSTRHPARARAAVPGSTSSPSSAAALQSRRMPDPPARRSPVPADYEKIRAENITRYGTDTAVLGLLGPEGYASAVSVESSGNSPFQCRAKACGEARRNWAEDSRRIEFGDSSAPVVRLSTVNGPVSIRSDGAGEE